MAAPTEKQKEFIDEVIHNLEGFKSLIDLDNKKTGSLIAQAADIIATHYTKNPDKHRIIEIRVQNALSNLLNATKEV